MWTIEDGEVVEEIITHTGSKASGKKVEVKTGNNLSIESGIHLQRGITALRDIGKLQKI
ncbi:hypothetical protein [Dialister invisus]|uniref:hypothetical protein n=1 Tax=Dialister invisus TaxID=218538 RepID=UPI00265EDA55|nr:hypothetical protein [Dialister invisus]